MTDLLLILAIGLQALSIWRLQARLTKAEYALGRIVTILETITWSRNVGDKK